MGAAPIGGVILVSEGEVVYWLTGAVGRIAGLVVKDFWVVPVGFGVVVEERTGWVAVMVCWLVDGGAVGGWDGEELVKGMSLRSGFMVVFECLLRGSCSDTCKSTDDFVVTEATRQDKRRKGLSL